MTVNVNECELIKYKDTFLKQLKYGDDVIYELPAQTTMKKVNIPYIPEIHTSIGTPSFPIWGELGTHECLVEQILDNPYRCSTIGRVSLFITNRLFRIARTSGTKCDVLTYFVLGSYDASTDTVKAAEVYAEKLQNIDTTDIDGVPALMEYIYTTKPAWKEECKHVVGTEWSSIAYVLTEGGTTIDLYNINNFAQVYSVRYVQNLTNDASFGVKDYRLWFLEREDTTHAQLNASKRRICNTYSGIWLMPYKAATVMNDDSATCANTATAFNTYAGADHPQFHTVFANYRIAPAVWYVEGLTVIHSTPIPSYYHKAYNNMSGADVRVNMNQGLLLNVPRQEYVDWCSSYSSIFSDLRVAYLNKYGADFKSAFVMLFGDNAGTQPPILASIFTDSKLPPRWDSPADVSRAVNNNTFTELKALINSHTSTDELTFNGTTWTWHRLVIFAIWIRYMYSLSRCSYFVDDVTEKVVENGKNVYYTMYPLTIARDLYEGSDTVDIRVMMHCATRGARSIYPSSLEDGTADINYLYKGFLGTNAKFGTSLNNNSWDMSGFSTAQYDSSTRGKFLANWNVKYYESIWRTRYESVAAYWNGYSALYPKSYVSVQNVQYPPLLFSDRFTTNEMSEIHPHTVFSYIRPSSVTLNFETDTYRNKWYIPRVIDAVAIIAGVRLPDKHSNTLNNAYKYPNLFVSTDNVVSTAVIDVKTHGRQYENSAMALDYTNEFDYYKQIVQSTGVQTALSTTPFDVARSGLLTTYNRTGNLDPTKSSLIHIYKHELEAVGAYNDLIDETLDTLRSYINIPSSTSLVSSALLTEGLGTWYDRDETVGYKVISVDPDDSRFNMVIVSTGGNNVQD